jgi:hypothetical protein
MADLLYPASLPGPDTWRQQRVDRRQMRDMRQPANANRLRWRDLGTNASATWVYPAEKMSIWMAWYEGALADQAARLRWFTAPLPGRGGAIARVARYVTPPKRVHCGAGLWKISADLYIRGASVTPQGEVSVADTGGFELREDDSIELREDGDYELRG